MDKEDILKQFDMMTLRQTKIIVSNQGIDVKLKKQEQHMDHTLKEVSEFRHSIQQIRSS